MQRNEDERTYSLKQEQSCKSHSCHYDRRELNQKLFISYVEQPSTKIYLKAWKTFRGKSCMSVWMRNLGGILSFGF